MSAQRTARNQLQTHHMDQSTQLTMEFLRSDVSLGHLALFLLLVSLVYLAALIVWRLHFSPCAGFPGSTLAAATGWYEFYYDYWLNGQYIFEIERMHKKYGEWPRNRLYY